MAFVAYGCEDSDSGSVPSNSSSSDTDDASDAVALAGSAHHWFEIAGLPKLRSDCCHPLGKLFIID